MFTRLRSALIRWLAQGEPVMMNVDWEIKESRVDLVMPKNSRVIFHNCGALDRVFLKKNGDYSRVGYRGHAPTT